MQRVLLRSNDRQRYYAGSAESTTSSSFTLPLAEPLAGKYAVRDWSIPNTIYCVTSANSAIYIYQSSSAFSGNLNAGTYTSSNITTEVARALNAIGGISGTFSCTYSSTTGKLTITNSTTAFQMDFSASQIGCAELLGFYRQRSASSATSQTADNVVNLSPINSFFIIIAESDQLYRNIRAAGIISGSIRVPVDAAYGNILSMDAKQPAQLLHFRQPAMVLSISLRDGSGAAVSLNGSDFELELEPLHD